MFWTNCNLKNFNQRCTCGNCSVTFLNGAREYRCCREIQETLGKLVFDGSIERIPCVTLHDDYKAMTNTAVLSRNSGLICICIYQFSLEIHIVLLLFTGIIITRNVLTGQVGSLLKDENGRSYRQRGRQTKNE